MTKVSPSSHITAQPAKSTISSPTRPRVCHDIILSPLPLYLSLHKVPRSKAHTPFKNLSPSSSVRARSSSSSRLALQLTASSPSSSHTLRRATSSSTVEIHIILTPSAAPRNSRPRASCLLAPVFLVVRRVLDTALPLCLVVPPLLGSLSKKSSRPLLLRSMASPAVTGSVRPVPDTMSRWYTMVYHSPPCFLETQIQSQVSNTVTCS